MGQIRIGVKQSSNSADPILFETPLALNSSQLSRSKRSMPSVPDQITKSSPEDQIVLEWESDDLVTRVVREVLFDFSNR
jgi:hypothetical protein